MASEEQIKLLDEYAAAIQEYLVAGKEYNSISRRRERSRSAHWGEQSEKHFQEAKKKFTETGDALFAIQRKFEASVGIDELRNEDLSL